MINSIPSNSELAMSTAFMQTYILKKWLVSTIRRRSSSRINPCMYYESLVWELDKETGKQKNIIDESSCADNELVAFKHHQNISNYFFEYEVRQ